MRCYGIVKSQQKIKYSFESNIMNFYCPQRSCGKVMFLKASVILFIGGGGVCGQGMHGWGSCVAGGEGGMHGGGST